MLNRRNFYIAVPILLGIFAVFVTIKFSSAGLSMAHAENQKSAVKQSEDHKSHSHTDEKDDHDKNDEKSHGHGHDHDKPQSSAKEDHDHGKEEHNDKDHDHSKNDNAEKAHDHDKGSEDEKGDGHGHGHGEEHVEGGKISDAAAKKLNIYITKAGNASIRETLSVTGRITLNQSTTAQVKARFPGVIRSVLKEPGHSVAVGETLATVESNESLQVYPVKAPVSGRIITRNANLGDLASDTPLFVVADLSQLWAELFVFSKDSSRVKPGQTVFIKCLDDPIHTKSTIMLVLPTADATSQTIIARSNIDNVDNHWRSGMNIHAEIVLSEKEVPVAVRTEAIQRMEGKTVVFIKASDNTYKAQPIEIGISDPEWTEVNNGLKPGQEYVSKNSFVVKADIGKASAEHEH